MIDKLTDQIASDFAKAESKDVCGILEARSMYDTIVVAKSRPNPRDLWNSCWYEGEVCCLFADSNLGKSILAVQIAEEVAEKEKVLYFDFELSDKQVQLRYTDEEGNLHKFPSNLLRGYICAEEITAIDDFEEAIISSIEQMAVGKEVKVIIIDNLTYLCSTAEKGDAAGSLMLKLMQLKRKYGWSILVLAHTPKRMLTNPITQNDLAGSKKLYNFFDSVFAIGKSAKDSNLRYVKQVKVRHGSYIYDTDNIMVYSIEKIGAALRFCFQGYAEEREHLKEPTENDSNELRISISNLKAQGVPYRDIAKRLGISLAKVQRELKK